MALLLSAVALLLGFTAHGSCRVMAKADASELFAKIGKLLAYRYSLLRCISCSYPLRQLFS